MSVHNLSLAQKSQLVGILELICQELEISERQYAEAKSRYETIAHWLSDSDDERLVHSRIYPQGSIRLGTTVKPIGREEFDVDLVCHLKQVNGGVAPREVNRFVGDRLRENATYRKMMQPLNRGWRINYANEFHLDITPSIKNTRCQNGGELVPDRQQQEWKPSNPLGYAKWFEAHAALQPAIEMAARAEVTPFPVQGRFKGVLRRSVQIIKRHRDMHAQDKDSDLKPISIILTTLAAKAYKMCIEKKGYQSDLDLLMDLLRGMVDCIQTDWVNGKKVYAILNETTVGENFAEKWNADPRRADAFFAWHRAAIVSLESVWTVEGIDAVAARLSKSFGPDVVDRSIKHFTQAIDTARMNNTLRVAPRTGLAVGSGALVQKNTFFGK